MPKSKKRTRTKKAKAGKKSQSKTQRHKHAAKESYLRKTGKDFLNSFKPDKSWTKIILYDLLFYAISIPFFMFAGWLLMKQADNIDLMAMNNQILTKSAEEIQAIAGNVQMFLFLFISSVIISVLVAILAWSLSRGLIYSRLLNKRFTKNFFTRFSALNLIIAVLAIVTLVIFSMISKASPSTGIYILFLMLMLAGAYFTTIIYVCFAEKKEVFSSIGKGLSIGVSKIRHLIVPGLLVLLVFIVISMLFGRIVPFDIAGRQLLSLAVLVMFLAWARKYFVPKVHRLI